MDLNKNAFRIVQSLTGEKAVSRFTAARNGGKRGGPARAKALSPERRREIAKTASRARWGTTDSKTSSDATKLKADASKLLKCKDNRQ